MDGLEAAEIILSKTSELSTFRIDSEYFLKRYLRYDELINKNPHSFTKLLDMGLTADASAFYPSLEPFYNCGEIPFIRVADVKNEVDYENCVKIPKMGAGFETLKLCKAGDIVLTKGGTIARAGLIKRDSYATRDLIFINSSKMSRDNYVSLFLLFCSKFMYDLMVKSSSQSVQPHLTITLIKDLPIFEFSEKFKKLLTSVYDLFEYSGVKSIELYKSAEKMLLDELGMSDFAPSTKAVAVKSFADSFGTSGRLDAEYYQPKYEEFGKILSKVPTHRVEDICTQINYGTV
ncbi:MAG: restriction endonuclease subunit S, partial [Defluviitaleaceae bacterium]|nr:restriction endonuclease subunit S [Defluviitaleaceae bacterium]